MVGEGGSRGRGHRRDPGPGRVRWRAEGNQARRTRRERRRHRRGRRDISAFQHRAARRATQYAAGRGGGEVVRAGQLDPVPGRRREHVDLPDASRRPDRSHHEQDRRGRARLGRVPRDGVLDHRFRRIGEHRGARLHFLSERDHRLSGSPGQRRAGDGYRHPRPDAAGLASGKIYRSTLHIQGGDADVTVQGAGTTSVSVPAGTYRASVVTATVTAQGQTLEVTVWIGRAPAR